MPSITVRLWWVRVKISIMSISSPSVAHWMCYFVYGACSWLCFAWNLKWNTHTHKKHLKIDQSLIRSQYIFTQPSPEEVRVRIPYRHLLIYVIWYTFRHKVHMVNTLSVSHMCKWMPIIASMAILSGHIKPTMHFCMAFGVIDILPTLSLPSIFSIVLPSKLTWTFFNLDIVKHLKDIYIVHMQRIQQSISRDKMG